MKALIHALIVIAFLRGMSHAEASFTALEESIDDTGKQFAVVFDFDTDSCYPSPAISRVGEINGGLRATGGLTGECRAKEQLTNSNTYYRRKCLTKDNAEYCVHMYALYFKKDQFLVGAGGHRHDWEYVLVWTKGREITHCSHSTHGKASTLPVGQLPFDAPNHVKIVYHKDGIATHAFRFAKKDEPPENEARKWITPPIINWETMKTENVNNAELRKKLNEHDFGEANCPVNDKNFESAIKEAAPDGSPFKQ